jgi:hypothetical protein
VNNKHLLFFPILLFRNSQISFPYQDYWIGFFPNSLSKQMSKFGFRSLDGSAFRGDVSIQGAKATYIMKKFPREQNVERSGSKGSVHGHGYLYSSQGYYLFVCLMF